MNRFDGIVHSVLMESRSDELYSFVKGLMHYFLIGKRLNSVDVYDSSTKDLVLPHTKDITIDDIKQIITLYGKKLLLLKNSGNDDTAYKHTETLLQLLLEPDNVALQNNVSSSFHGITDYIRKEYRKYVKNGQFQ